MLTNARNLYIDWGPKMTGPVACAATTLFAVQGIGEACNTARKPKTLQEASCVEYLGVCGKLRSQQAASKMFPLRNILNHVGNRNRYWRDLLKYGICNTAGKCGYDWSTIDPDYRDFFTSSLLSTKPYVCRATVWGNGRTVHNGACLKKIHHITEVCASKN